jgi:hypothetical protein
MSPLAGELVTETLEFDGGREVTAYVPPGSPEAICLLVTASRSCHGGPFSSSLPRAYLVAGTQEPFFLANAMRWRTRCAVPAPTLS